MATDNQRTVDFVIRAQNKSKRTLDEVRKEIESVSDAIDKQVKASERGEGSVKDLNNAYKALQSVTKDLTSQQSLVTQFEAQTTRLAELESRLAGATAKLEEHRAKMAQSEKVTQRQQKTQESLERAVTRAGEAIGKQSERIERTRTAAEQLGLGLDDAATAQDRLLDSARNLVATNNKLSEATENYGTNVERVRRAEQKLADEKTFAKKAKDAAELVKASEYTRWWAESLERMERSERELTETRAFEEKAREAAKLVKAAEYTRFWTQALEKAEIAERQLANNNAINDAADRAVAAARGYTTLGDASKRLVQNSKPLAGVIRSIVDPAEAARSTMDGLEEQVRAIAAAAKSAEGPVKGYREQVKALADAQKAAVAQGTNIDAYQKQVVALRAARSEFAQARGRLLDYAAAMRQAEAPTAEMQAEQRALEQSLAGASARMATQIQRTRELRTGLREAGVDTGKLAAAQSRLVGVARSANAAMGTLNERYNRHGEAVSRASRSQGVFRDEGRTTLSFMQRLRGEVIALTSTYIGLQGALNLANNSLEAYNSKIGVQNQLALGTDIGNDPAKIAAEYAYIAEQADRIGVGFADAAKGYARFSAAASLAGRGRQEIRYVAETFMEVGAVANVTADEMQGVFKALEQVYSKGKIQAEELRGQLGDRLFGAFEIAAKALQDEFPDLNKAMEQGLVTSDQLLKIAEQYRKTVADQLPTAMDSLRANQNRLNNEITFFQQLIAESGFADDYGRLVGELTEFFQSDDGKEFAIGISDAFSMLVDVLSWALEHIDEITLALKTLGFAWGVTKVAAMTEALFAAAVQMRGLTAAMATGTVAARILRGALALVTAAVIGWQIGKYAYEQFEEVRQFGVALVIGMLKLVTQIEYAFKTAFNNVGGYAKNMFNKAMNDMERWYNAYLGLLSKMARSIGMDSLADGVLSFQTDGVARDFRDLRAETQKFREDMNAELAKIDEIGFSMFQDAADKPAAAKAGRGGTPTERPEIDISRNTEAADEKARKAAEKLAKKQAAEAARLAKQKATLAEGLVRTLEGIDAKIAKNEKLSLEERLRGITVQYEKVYRDIEKLSKMTGGEEVASGMKLKLDTYIELLKRQETEKFNLDEMKRRESDVNQQIELRQQLLDTIQSQQASGDLTQLQAKERMAEVDERMVPAIQQAAAAAIQWAQANSSIFDTPEKQELFIAKMQAISASAQKTTAGLVDWNAQTEKFADGLADSFMAFGDAIARGENGIRGMRDAFLNFAASFLREIAKMILQQMILNALKSGLGAMSGGASTAGSAMSSVQASQMHTGGLVGHSTNGVTRSVSPSWFSGAPRYHSGGIVGLAPDEYPTILQKNEEVLSADEPRNILNGGGAGGSQAPSIQDVTINNHVDAESFMGAALATASGRKLIMNVLQSERSQLRSLVGR